MDQPSDQQRDGNPQIPSGEGVPKKGYPGLVLVPPSDRTILRRRLIRGGLLLVAVIWTVSTFTTRPPASDNPENCPSESDRPSTEGSAEKCAPPSTTMQPETPSNEFSLTQVSQAEGLTEPPNLAHLENASKPEPEQASAQPIAEPNSPPTRSDSAEHRTEQPAGHAGHEKTTASRPPEKSLSSSHVDVHLATQGDVFAQYRLGRYFAQRDGRQAPEAVSWYKKAFPGLHRLAETGNAQAMYVLGVMYAYGRGVSRDPEQARRWLTQAVEHKIAAAQPVLANLPVPARTNSHLQAAEHAKIRKQQN